MQYKSSGNGQSSPAEDAIDGYSPSPTALNAGAARAYAGHGGTIFSQPRVYRDSNTCASTQSGAAQEEWWIIDLKQDKNVGQVKITVSSNSVRSAHICRL